MLKYLILFIFVCLGYTKMRFGMDDWCFEDQYRPEGELEIDVWDADLLKAERQDDLHCMRTHTRSRLNPLSLLNLLGIDVEDPTRWQQDWWNWLTHEAGLNKEEAQSHFFWSLPVIWTTIRYMDLVSQEAPEKREANPSIALAAKKIDELNLQQRYWEAFELQVCIQVMRDLDKEDAAHETAVDMEATESLFDDDAWTVEDWEEVLLSSDEMPNKEWHTRLTPLCRGGYRECHIEWPVCQEEGQYGVPMRIAKTIAAHFGDEPLIYQEIEGTSTQQWGRLKQTRQEIDWDAFDSRFEEWQARLRKEVNRILATNWNPRVKIASIKVLIAKLQKADFGGLGFRNDIRILIDELADKTSRKIAWDLSKAIYLSKVKETLSLLDSWVSRKCA